MGNPAQCVLTLKWGTPPPVNKSTFFWKSSFYFYLTCWMSSSILFSLRLLCSSCRIAELLSYRSNKSKQLSSFSPKLSLKQWKYWPLLSYAFKWKYRLDLQFKKEKRKFSEHIFSLYPKVLNIYELPVSLSTKYIYELPVSLSTIYIYELPISLSTKYIYELPVS